MEKLRLPSLLSYADLMEMFSCSRDTVRRMWKLKKVIPAPFDAPGLGLRWWDYEIFGYLASLGKSGRQDQK